MSFKYFNKITLLLTSVVISMNASAHPGHHYHPHHYLVNVFGTGAAVIATVAIAYLVFKHIKKVRSREDS